ncbi:hypothetical protein ACFLW8_03940 [Chloroflexota bacterium]
MVEDNGIECSLNEWNIIVEKAKKAKELEDQIEELEEILLEEELKSDE